jgi:hypothetical protein
MYTVYCVSPLLQVYYAPSPTGVLCTLCYRCINSPLLQVYYEPAAKGVLCPLLQAYYPLQLQVLYPLC